MANSFKNLERFLTISQGDISQGDRWKKGANIFDLNQTELAKPVLDAFTLTKFDSLKVLTVKPGDELEIQGTNKNGSFYKRT